MRPKTQRAATVVGYAVVLAPLVVLALRVAVEGAPAPRGDVGLIALRVSDVGAHLPLLGSYSRFGYNQPGPLLFLGMAAPFRILGSRYAGVEVGAVLVAGLSLVAVLGVARRRVALPGFALVVALATVFVHGLGPGWLADAWEPHVLVPVGLATVVLAFDVLAGRSWSLVGVVLGASLIAQAWSTMLPFAFVMGGWALGGLVIQAVRAPERRTSAMLAVVAAGSLAIVLWAAPVYQQVTGWPGNLTAMRGALGGSEPRLGPAGAWRLVAGELDVRATWVGFPQRLDGLSTEVDVDAAPIVPVGAIVLAAGATAAVWRRRRDAVRLVATVVVAGAAATASLSMLIGPVYVWIPQWLRLVGVLAWAAGLFGLAAGLPRPAAPWLRRAGTAAGLGLGFGFSVWTLVAAVGDWREPDPLRDAVARLAAIGASSAEFGDTVLVRSRVRADSAFGSDDLALEVLVTGLESRGIDVVVDKRLAYKFGDVRARDTSASGQLVLTNAEDPIPPGFREVGSIDPLGARRQTRRALLRSIGLNPDATTQEALRAASVDRSIRPVADRLRDLPDLPVVALLEGPAPGGLRGE